MCHKMPPSRYISDNTCVGVLKYLKKNESDGFIWQIDIYLVSTYVKTERNIENL